MSTSTEAVVIGRRFQKVSSYHFNHQIKCVAPQGTDAVAVHCTEGSEHVTSVHPLTPHSNYQRRASIEKAVQRFLYVKKYRVYVMFCGDLSLRVFSDTFQHMQTVPTASTALCMEFVDATSTLYIGQSGCVKAWHLVNQLHCPLEPDNQSTVSVANDEWVVGLDYEQETAILAAATEKKVILIDTKLHREIATYSGKSSDSITGALLFSSLGYLVIAFRNGLIEVLNIVLNSVVGELTGHFKTVTTLKRHVTGSCLISCSLDGTVRLWSLETPTECNRLDLGMELLGLSVSSTSGGGGGHPETAQLLVHSHQDISVWHLSQLETHFASMYSNTLALSRVQSPDIARIMATAEDGSVRLISPVTGDIITTFFPIFTADILSEVVYCPMCGLLFALLAAGEVLVVASLTNPCSTLQLWTSTNREKIQTISTCMVEWKGQRHSLVFGGSLCGHILLLHSSHFTMEPPCPAHGGRVCKLIPSASPVELTTPSTPCLLSLGSDNFLNAWSIRVNRKGDRVSLKMLTCIQMERAPVQISLLGTLLCVATGRNTVEMVDTSPEMMGDHQNPYLPQGRLFSRLRVMTHQREDRHTDTITSLSSCPRLSLFATTSLDGLLKVWTTTNTLVSEIDFGERLLSACFSNSCGDLLVGFQRQICRVTASHYLPASYLSPLAHTANSSLVEVEEPISFDPTLQFWYDPERVPSVPVQGEERNKTCSLLENYHTTSQYPSQTLQQQRKESVGKVNAEKTRPSSVASGTMRVELVMQSSHHLVASAVDVSTGIPPDNSSLSSLRRAIMCGLGAMKSQELARALTVEDKKQTHGVQRRLVAPGREFPARVTPLQTPFSPSLPIAPDCLIPNSTLRGTIGYVPAPDPLSFLQQSTIDRILATSPDSRPDLERLRGKRRKKRRRTADGGVGVPGSPSGESVSESDGESCCELESQEFGDEALTEEGDEFSEDGVKSSSVVVASTFGSVNSVCEDSEKSERNEDTISFYAPVSMVESTPPPQKVYTPGKIQSETKLAPQPSPEFNTERGSPVRDKSDKQIESNKTATSSDAPITPLLRRHESVTPVAVVETKTIPTVTIPLHVGLPKTTAVKSTPAGSTGSSGRETGAAKSERVAETVPKPAREPTADTEKSPLQKAMGIAHFPSSLCHSITTVQEVCDKMVSMLRCVDADSIRDISSAIVELKRDVGLSEAQESAVAQVLVTRLRSSSSSVAVRQATLLALERLSVTADDSTLLPVLPCLLDSNVGVRKAAFRTLQAISGISSRSELHCRLIEMGILQHIESDEDEILRGLSMRLEREAVVTATPHLPPTRAGGGKQVREDKRGARERGRDEGRREEEEETTTPDKAVEGEERYIAKEKGKDNTRSGEKQKDENKSEEIGDRGSPSNNIERVSTAPLTTRGGIQSKSSVDHTLVPRGDHMALFQHRLRHQPILHIITTATGGRELKRGNQPGARPIIPISGSRTKNKTKSLHKLLATQPTKFSQSSPIREIMRGAHPSTGGVGVERREREFRWSEVFPVLSRKCDRSATAGCQSRERDGEQCSKTEDAEFKLPKIS